MTFMFSLLTVNKSQWEANNLEEKKMCRMRLTPILQTGTEGQNSHLEDPQRLKEMKINLNVMALLWAFEPFLAG